MESSAPDSATASGPGSSLRARLREGTADLHAAVERSMDLPASVCSLRDYADLLRRCYDLHSGVESRWSAPGWARAWGRVGIDLAQHRRASLLEADLLALGEAAPTAIVVARLPTLASWGEGLGSLYVLEGSSLGGRVLGPAIRAALGPVPTTFFDGSGRESRTAWRSVGRALAQFEGDGGDGDEVLRGARDTFVAFGDHVARADLSGLR